MATAGASNTVAFDYAALLPPERDYYTYLGSLPYPPCTPSVRHYVFSNPVGISERQIAHFRQVMGWLSTPTRRSHTALTPFGNYRPLQSSDITTRDIQRFVDMGLEEDIRLSDKRSVFYDHEVDEDSDLFQNAKVYAYVSIVLGLLGTMVSIAAVVRVFFLTAAPSEPKEITNGSSGKEDASPGETPRNESAVSPARGETPTSTPVMSMTPQSKRRRRGDKYRKFTSESEGSTPRAN